MFCIWCGSPAAGTATLSCSACGRTLYLHSKISASALTVLGDDYLVVRRGEAPYLGAWDLPGGFCEYGEAPGAAAVRETFEESGLRITTHALLGVWMDEYTEPDGTAWPTVNLVFLGRLVDPAEASNAPEPGGGEVTGRAWFALASPPGEVAFPEQQLGAIEAFRRSV